MDSAVARNKWTVIAPLALAIALSGCAVGPRYSKAQAPSVPSYKETPPNWTAAQPNDQVLRGKWWEIFQEPQLNAMEEKIIVSNQTLRAAQQQFLVARAQIKLNRSNYYPTVTVGTSATRFRQSQNRPLRGINTDYTDLILPADLSYEVDVWERVRRTVEAARAEAQASAADVQSVSLSLHAELAVDYFELRSLDAEAALLNSTVAADEKALELTENRYKGGLASGVDVAQAQTQLETTRAQAIDIGVARAQFEHAIAALIGQPASTFSIPVSPTLAEPPAIPPGMPAQLLERRPDIAAVERRMAEANAQIGVAKAAYFPLVSLSASAGFEGSTISNWLMGPSGFASLGAAAVVTAFDGGRRHAVSNQARAIYTQAQANYQQTILTAFQEVEDNLAALRILQDEAKTQQAAVIAAQRSLDLSISRYKGGVANYLEVTTAQTIALTDQRTAVDILRRQAAATVLLIKALGGGWETNSLPGSFTMSNAGQ